MFWWTVAIRAAVRTAAIRIQAVAKRNVGGVILRDNTPRRIGQILDGTIMEPLQILRVPLHLFEIEFPPRAVEPVGRVKQRAMSGLRRISRHKIL